MPFLALKVGWVVALSTGTLMAFIGAALWLLIDVDKYSSHGVPNPITPEWLRPKVAVTIDPITPALGAEVRLDLSDLNADSVSLIYDALMTYQALFFRDRTTTPEQQVALGEQFGEIDIPTRCIKTILTYRRSPFSRIMVRPPDTNDWHKDLTFRESPSLCRSCWQRPYPKPAVTRQANMAMAYETYLRVSRAQSIPSMRYTIGCFRNDYLGSDRNIKAMNDGVHDDRLGASSGRSSQ